ncbi:MAG: hypothetical protein IJX57_02050 [Clostridia bacterium]|nr:hypothetical protein [Clostridia bacterium]
MGRPTKFTDEVVNKLEYAFSKGFNITEACNYAEISRETYYNYLEENQEFFDKMERAQTALQRRAKINLAERIEGGDIDESKYYLERKCKDEFSSKQEIQHSGNMNINNPMSGLTTEELRKLIQSG